MDTLKLVKRKCKEELLAIPRTDNSEYSEILLHPSKMFFVMN